MAAIMARFQKTGATYETKKRRWLLRIPSAQALTTRIPVMGKRMRTRVTVSACFSGDHWKKKSPTSQGATSTPARASPPATTVRIPSAAPAKRPASSSRPSSRNSA